jgi:hypothetical protein
VTREAGALVSLFAVDLAAATEAWGAGTAAARPGGRLEAARAAGEPPAALFDAYVEDRAAAHLYDAPLAALAAALDSVGRAAKLRVLDIAGLEAARSAYPVGVAPKGGAGLVAWLEEIPPEAAAAARGDLGAAPRGVDGELWRDLVDVVAELLAAAACPGMAIVGYLS